MYNVPVFYHSYYFLFIRIWYIFLVSLRLLFKEGRDKASGLDERCTMLDVFIICILVLSFNCFFFGQPETKTKSALNRDVNVFMGFSIDILQDYFFQYRQQDSYMSRKFCVALIVNDALQIINNRCTTFRERLLFTLWECS